MLALEEVLAMQLDHHPASPAPPDPSLCGSPILMSMLDGELADPGVMAHPGNLPPSYVVLPMPSGAHHPMQLTQSIGADLGNFNTVPIPARQDRAWTPANAASGAVMSSPTSEGHHFLHSSRTSACDESGSERGSSSNGLRAGGGGGGSTSGVGKTSLSLIRNMSVDINSGGNASGGHASGGNASGGHASGSQLSSGALFSVGNSTLRPAQVQCQISLCMAQ